MPTRHLLRHHPVPSTARQVDVLAAFAAAGGNAVESRRETPMSPTRHHGCVGIPHDGHSELRRPMETTPFSFGRHLIVALAIGVLAPFTLWAWPFAIATGIVIGTADVEKAHGQTAPRSTKLVRVAAVTGGVLAMFVAGAFVGGIVGFFVAALADFSERMAADASPTDRNLARILLFVGGALGWIVSAALGFQLYVRFGA